MRLFVYGIFLAEDNRLAFGMSNPCYATVQGFATYGYKIVTAYRSQPLLSMTQAGFKSETPASLTGLVVTVDPRCWEELDALEKNYDRIKVRTTDQETVFMYAAKGTRSL